MEGWQVQGDKNDKGEVCGKVYLTTDGAYQGRSLCFEKLRDIDTLMAGGWSVPVQPAEVYSVRAQAKTLGNTAFIWLNVLNDKKDREPGGMAWMRMLAPGQYGGGTGVALDGPRLPDLGATYAPMAAVFEIPAEAAWLQISLAGWNYSYSTSNKVYFDNVKLYRLAARGTEGVSCKIMVWEGKKQRD